MLTARVWLVAAAAMSILAALLHLACIVGGPDWYRALGAGERMARMAERGRPGPAIVTAAIAGMLAIWALYALSAARIVTRLPLTRGVLVLISAVLIARGIGAPLVPRWRPDLSAAFLYASSAIVLVYGLTFAIGTWLAWPTLSMKEHY